MWSRDAAWRPTSQALTRAPPASSDGGGAAASLSGVLAGCLHLSEQPFGQALRLVDRELEHGRVVEVDQHVRRDLPVVLLEVHTHRGEGVDGLPGGRYR